MKLSAIASGVTSASTSVICVRVRNLICRNRCWIDCINELLCLRSHCSCEKCALAILRCSTSEIIILSLQTRNLCYSAGAVVLVELASGQAVAEIGLSAPERQNYIDKDCYIMPSRTPPMTYSMTFYDYFYVKKEP